MKKILFTIALFSIVSCGEENNNVENQKNTAELMAYEDLKVEEESTKKFIEDYLKDVNSSDWKSKLPKYLQPNSEDFIEEHSAFRKSFPNYKANIKYLTVDGNEGIVWMNITANYATPYILENSSEYGDNILKGIKAENQPLSWDETWYFDVVDGRFGDKFDFLKDNYAVLNSLKTVEK